MINKSVESCLVPLISSLEVRIYAKCIFGSLIINALLFVFPYKTYVSANFDKHYMSQK